MDRKREQLTQDITDEAVKWRLYYSHRLDEAVDAYLRALDAGGIALDREPVHDWFGLSYGNYFVLPRSLMEAMPIDWQRRWRELVAEMEDEFDVDRIEAHSFRISVVDNEGRFIHDPLANYRHPDRDYIEGLRRQ